MTDMTDSISQCCKNAETDNITEEKRTDIKGLYLHELKKLLSSERYKGIPPYRAAEINKFVLKGAKSFDEMTSLPLKLREMLSEDFYIPSAETVRVQRSSIDGTRKYLFSFDDKNMAESVYMQYHHGNTACISTQAGCRMGCAFCATGKNGYFRDLLASEMLLQIEEMQRETGTVISNVVLMGMGEPLDNYENTVRFIRLANDKNGLNIGQRHFSLSTCGLVDKIYKLAEEELSVGLSVSLHAPDDVIRQKIMPVSKKYDMRSLLEACRFYADKTKRRVTYEYTMIKGLNDSERCAEVLALKIRGTLCHVNLIPVNPVKGSEFEPSGRETVKRFAEKLSSLGINVTVRRKLGSDIDASCGQLKAKTKSGA